MNNLFLNISKNNQEKLLKLLEATKHFFKKNTNISSITNDSNNLIIIESGEIQIVRNDYNGNRVIIKDFTKNDMFGSIIFPLSNQEYEITTKEDTRLIIIDYSRILNNTDNWPVYYQQFVRNLLQITTNKINEKNKQI